MSRRAHLAQRQRDRRARLADEAAHDQFMRDLRGDHDGPASYRWMPPADSTPCVAEILSREA